MKSMGMFLCAAVLSILSVSPALAFMTQATGEARAAIERFGEAYQAVASSFGCAEFAFGNFSQDNTVLTLEYVPAGDKVESWTRMMTVTVYQLPNDPQKDAEAMNALMNSLQASYQAQGKVLNSTFFRNAQGEPGAFLEYEIGELPFKEHNAGVFMRASPQTAAFIQIQSRGKPFDPSDAAKVFSLIEAPKAEPGDIKRAQEQQKSSGAAGQAAATPASGK